MTDAACERTDRSASAATELVYSAVQDPVAASAGPARGEIDRSPEIAARQSWRDSWCLFLDVDGTLLDVAETPDAVVVAPELVGVLARAAAALGGAVALISGRSIDTLDRLFAPLRLPSAGVHGVERRNAQGTLTRGAIDWLPLATARHAMLELAHRHPHLTLEDKGLSLALHWRRDPSLEGTVRALLAGLADRLGPNFELQQGVCVLEIKPSRQDKGTAVEAFLRESPFRGRIPLFIGDDLSDEDAFRVVERHGGWAIGVGARANTPLRFTGPAAVRDWLAQLVGPSGFAG